MGGIGTKNIKNVLFFEDTLRLLQNRWKLDVYFFAFYSPNFKNNKKGRVRTGFWREKINK